MKVLSLKNFNMQETTAPKGVQVLLDFGKYQLSIVRNEVSYGNRSGLYEIAVFDDVDQVELPGVTEPGDTVKGFLSENDIDTILKKMYSITGQEPVQI